MRAIALVVAGVLVVSLLATEGRGQEGGVTAAPAGAAGADSAQMDPPGDTKVYPRSRVTFLKDFYRVASIQDRETIHIFNKELGFGCADSSIQELKIVDLNQNDFGAGDYVVLEPSGESVLLSMSDSIRAVMNEWKTPDRAEFYERDAAQLDVDLEVLGRENTRANEVTRCKLCAIKGLMSTLSKVYFGTPIRLYVERKAEGTIQADIWGFDEDSFSFSDCRAGSDTIPFFDVIQVSRKDTVMVAERNYFDLIFVSRTDAETLFVAQPGVTGGRSTWEAPAPLPGSPPVPPPVR